MIRSLAVTVSRAVWATSVTGTVKVTALHVPSEHIKRTLTEAAAMIVSFHLTLPPLEAPLAQRFAFV